MYTKHCLAVKWIQEFSYKPYNNPLIKYYPHITDEKNEAYRRLSPNKVMKPILEFKLSDSRIFKLIYTDSKGCL